MSEHERRTVPSSRTREEEDRDARVPAGERAPSESGDAPESDPPEGVDEETAAHYRDMTERGAKQQGEGRLP